MILLCGLLNAIHRSSLFTRIRFGSFRSFVRSFHLPAVGIGSIIGYLRKPKDGLGFFRRAYVETLKRCFDQTLEGGRRVEKFARKPRGKMKIRRARRAREKINNQPVVVVGGGSRWLRLSFRRMSWIYCNDVVLSIDVCTEEEGCCTAACYQYTGSVKRGSWRERVLGRREEAEAAREKTLPNRMPI